MQKSLKDSILTSMDGSDKEIFLFLPYIFQDIWEIGTDPKIIIKLINKNFKDCQNLNVLDLGCGKGAVSIKIALKLGCKCHGIDAMPEFISEANKKAKKYKVKNLCKFEIGDIREIISKLSVFDVIILGSIGPVFGDYYETLTELKKNLKSNGIIIIDDGFIKDNDHYSHPLILKKQKIIKQIDSSGMKLIKNYIIKKDKIKNSDDIIFSKIKKRCLELIEKHPDKKNIFEEYLKKQIQENDVLENKIVCSTFVMKSID